MPAATFKPIRNTELPSSFRTIRLELAREPDHPAGDARIAYVVLAPLGADGKLDQALWKTHREACRVVRFRPDGDDRGHLVHRPGGSWSFRYDVAGSSQEEVGYHFSDERFVVGEYVSVKEGDAVHPFRVVAVGPP